MRLMQKLFFRKKLNNKGNTLGVVVIGILLLGILGTLILNVTAANYQMKIVDNQSKKNFYYVEKAVDEIYAGIGIEAMAAVSEAYQDVLENMVSYDEVNGKYVTLNNTQANAKFSEVYFDKLRYKYIDEESTGLPLPIEDTLNVLKGYIEEVSNITYNVELLSTTDIRYDEAEKRIVFQDIRVSTRTNSGYYAAVTTDFVINLPDADMGFKDSDAKNLDELYKFALVVDGYETLQNKVNNNIENIDSLLHVTKERLNRRDIASMTVESSWSGTPTSIIGNIYVGTNSVSKKDSVKVNSGADLSVEARNFICGGSVVLQNAQANLEGLSEKESVDLVEYGLLDEGEERTNLRLWANNLITENAQGDGVVTVSNENKLTVNGDCIIADDLEINGDNSTVKIMGNYFGYGYGSSSTDKAVEANSSETTMFDNNSSANDFAYEHEKRSAIIINAKNADVTLIPATENDVVILGGRAYIDLETGETSTGNATYMTGESVSFKGNQNLYKAENDDLGTVITSNPVAYSKLLPYISGTTLDYAALGIDPTKVIAKRVQNSVYFYKYNNDPVSQTEYFMDRVNNSFITRDAIQEQIGKLKVENLKLGNGNDKFKKIYSVGAITQVDGGNLVSYQPVSGVSYGKLEPEFLNLINEMKYRYDFISSELQDFEGKGYGELANASDTAKNTTVYSNFIDETKLAAIMTKYQSEGGGTRYEEQNIEEKYVPADVAEEFCERVFGKDIYNINLGVTMMDNARTGGDVLTTEREYGVIVATGDVNITKDFTGIIICGGNLTVSNGATVTACPELIALLATYDPKLSDLLGTNQGNLGGESVVNVQDTDYQKLVSLENWRKN